MTSQTLNTYEASDLEHLVRALKEALDDAGDDRIAEGGGVRVHPSEIYLSPTRVKLIRERLTDGSYVYNLSIRTVQA